MQPWPPAVRAMSLSYDASGHKLSVLFIRVPNDIITLSSWSGRAVHRCLYPSTRKRVWDFRAVHRQHLAVDHKSDLYSVRPVCTHSDVDAAECDEFGAANRGTMRIPCPHSGFHKV